MNRSTLGSRPISAQSVGISERIRIEIKALLSTKTLPALGPQARADALSEAALNTKLDPVFRDAQLSVSQQELVRALLLLWHDHLDASHNISQNIENADGSFVHALMHRREPDYWNAKYWWRRGGAHPAFPEIARRTGELLKSSGNVKLAAKLLPGGHWDACAFVDLCEQATSDSQHVDLLRDIQRIETETLLESILAR